MDKLEKIKQWYNSHNSAFPFDVYTLDDETVEDCYELLYNGLVGEPSTDFAIMIYADYFMQIIKDYDKSIEYYKKLFSSEYMYMKSGSLSTVGMLYFNTGYDKTLGKKYIKLASETDDILAIKIYLAFSFDQKQFINLNLYKRAFELSSSDRDDLSKLKWYKINDNEIDRFVNYCIHVSDYNSLFETTRKYFKEKLPKILERYLNNVKLNELDDKYLEYVKDVDLETVISDPNLSTTFKMLVRLLKQEREYDNLFEVVI